ncbi:MAG TPA: substrate-binding domain-containing protein [bacterium]|jgi:ABC-type molybdate transport system substrate-binding protein
MKHSGKAVFSKISALIAGAILFGSCAQQSDEGRNSPPIASSNLLRVQADQSLKPVLFEIASLYERDNSAKLSIVYAPSLQIQPDRTGDSVDVYLLANNGYPTAPENADSTARVILSYAIPCIIVPELNPALVTDLKYLQQTDMLVGIADPASDILGRFTIEILKKNGVYSELSPRLVPIGPSALELADAVARGDVDAAIGWTVFPNWTGGSADVILLNDVEIPRIAAISAWRALSPVDSTSAARFMNYLQTEGSLACFRKYGYLVLDSDLEMYAPIAQVGGMPED